MFSFQSLDEPKLNVGKKRFFPSLTEDEILKLKADNTLDTDLHRYAGLLLDAKQDELVRPARIPVRVMARVSQPILRWERSAWLKVDKVLSSRSVQ